MAMFFRTNIVEVFKRILQAFYLRKFHLSMRRCFAFQTKIRPKPGNYEMLCSLSSII